MSGGRPVQLGSVVWAELPDSNGFMKLRPAVVVTPTSQFFANNSMRVVAISTKIPEPLPNDHVLLPWNRDGNTRSGLRRPCVAVLNWQAGVETANVNVVGYLPAAVTKQVLEKLAAILGENPS